MGFPIEADIIEQIKKVAAGEKAEKVTTSHPPVDAKECGLILVIFARKKNLRVLISNHIKGHALDDFAQFAHLQLPLDFGRHQVVFLRNSSKKSHICSF